MKMTARLNIGFAFIPLLYLIGALIVVGGVGVAVTKKLQTQSDSQTIESSPSSSEVTQEAEASPQNQVASSSVVTAKDTSVENDEEPRDVSTESIISMLPTRTFPTKVENAPTVPVVESTGVDSQLQITYNQVKVESDYLTEALEFLRDRLKETESFQSQNLAICSSQYKDDISQAKADAENLKQSYLESRTGYAYQPSAIQEIDTALAYDLKQIESEYEYCKSKYAVDSSIKNDINSISSSQSSIMNKLTLSNSASSLSEIHTLQNKAINLADKF
jgi:hypothetical protein